jgi:regulator of replication initiation timing
MNELNLAVTVDPIAALQTQIDSVLAQLAVIIKRIQEIAAENETLRRQVADLQRQLAQQTSPRPV